MAQRMTADDLFDGLLLTLSREGVQVLTLRMDRVDRAAASVFERLRAVADKCDVRPVFNILRDPIHGDSRTVRDAIGSAALRDLVSLDNPEYQHIRLKKEVLEASVDLDELPGGSAMYEDLAKHFLQSYSAKAETAGNTG